MKNFLVLSILGINSLFLTTFVCAQNSSETSSGSTTLNGSDTAEHGITSTELEILNELKEIGISDDVISTILESEGVNPDDYLNTSKESSTTNSTTKTSNGTTTEGRKILNQLKAEGRTEEQIQEELEFYGIDASAYFNSSNSKTQNTTSTQKTSNGTTSEGRKILNQLKAEGRTEEQIQEELEFYGIDASAYFGLGNINKTEGEQVGTYTSRSCKIYNIIYNEDLGVYTSPNLQKYEYFINRDYLERYIDSKNPEKDGCGTTNWITITYNDKSNSSAQYIAPNGKVYFIEYNNGYFSEELNINKKFTNIEQLKYYIRDRNPLIGMN